MVHQSRGDLNDMTVTLLFHLGDGELGDVEEAVDVDTHHGRIVGQRVLGERLGDEDSGIVDQGIDATKPSEPFGDHTLAPSCARQYRRERREHQHRLTA